MKRYSLYHLPLLSFYSKNLYRDIAHNWKGLCFLYLFLLVAVTSLPLAFGIHAAMSHFAENEAQKLISQFPTLTITNGKASIEEPQPYFIGRSDPMEPYIVIDTTGEISALEDTDAMALITETHLAIELNDFETRTFSFNAIDDLVVDQEALHTWVDMAKKIIAPLVYVFLLGFFFVFHLIQVLLCAAVGILFARMTGFHGSYSSLIRLSVVAISPGLIIKTLLDIADTPLPNGGLIYFLVALGFLYFGVKSAAEEPAEHSPLKPFAQG